MTAVEALWLVQRLRAVYPGDVDDQTAIHYRRLLERLSYVAASEAIDRVIARSKTWPRFSLIRDEYRQVVREHPEAIHHVAETDEERSALAAEMRAWAQQHLGGTGGVPPRRELVDAAGDRAGAAGSAVVTVTVAVDAGELVVVWSHHFLQPWSSPANADTAAKPAHASTTSRAILFNLELRSGVGECQLRSSDELTHLGLRQDCERPLGFDPSLLGCLVEWRTTGHERHEVLTATL